MLSVYVPRNKNRLLWCRRRKRAVFTAIISFFSYTTEWKKHIIFITPPPLISPTAMTTKTLLPVIYLFLSSTVTSSQALTRTYTDIPIRVCVRTSLFLKRWMVKKERRRTRKKSSNNVTHGKWKDERMCERISEPKLFLF